MTQLQAANRILDHAGLINIKTIDDNGAPMAFIKENWELVYRECLLFGGFNWTHAIKQTLVKMIPLSEVQEAKKNFYDIDNFTWKYANAVTFEKSEFYDVYERTEDYPENPIPKHLYEIIWAEYNPDPDVDTLEEYTDAYSNRDIWILSDIATQIYLFYLKYTTFKKVDSIPISFAAGCCWLMGHYLSDRFGGTERSAYCKQMWYDSMKKALKDAGTLSSPDRPGGYTLLEDEWRSESYYQSHGWVR